MIREMKQVREDSEWLRWQVGPVIHRQFNGVRPPAANEMQQAVFHLKGWGPNLNTAISKAIRKGYTEHPLPIDPPPSKEPSSLPSQSFEQRTALAG